MPSLPPASARPSHVQPRAVALAPDALQILRLHAQLSWQVHLQRPPAPQPAVCASGCQGPKGRLLPLLPLLILFHALLSLLRSAPPACRGGRWAGGAGELSMCTQAITGGV